jgi:hypothetical protein
MDATTARIMRRWLVDLSQRSEELSNDEIVIELILKSRYNCFNDVKTLGV